MLNRYNRHFFVRNIEAENLLESFLVYAILAVLGIRFFLTLTDYPLLGGEVLHIAHMLWGGLLMVVALVLSFAFLNKTVMRAAAVIGGLGFGAFIDELGKFITQDNDYFFQPTIALIYIVFVLFFLFIRLFKRYRSLSKKEYLANALANIREAISSNLSDQEKEQTFKLLNKCGSNDPTVKALKKVLHQFDSVSLKRLSPLAKVRQLFADNYRQLIKRRWFKNAVITFFIAQAVILLFQSMALVEHARILAFSMIVGVLFALYLIKAAQAGLSRGKIILLIGTFIIFIIIFWNSFFNLQILQFSFIEQADLIFSAIPGILVLVGVFSIKRSRLSAYSMFKYAILISIFLTQFFAFYELQFIALIGLTMNILIFYALKYAIAQEE